MCKSDIIKIQRRKFQSLLKVENYQNLTFKQKGNIPWNKGLKTGTPSHNAKPVIKLDLNDNYLAEYKSIKEVIINNPYSTTIIRVCNGKTKTSGGFKWKWK